MFLHMPTSLLSLLRCNLLVVSVSKTSLTKVFSSGILRRM